MSRLSLTESKQAPAAVERKRFQARGLESEDIRLHVLDVHGRVLRSRLPQGSNAHPGADSVTVAEGDVSEAAKLDHCSVFLRETSCCRLTLAAFHSSTLEMWLLTSSCRRSASLDHLKPIPMSVQEQLNQAASTHIDLMHGHRINTKVWLHIKRSSQYCFSSSQIAWQASTPQGCPSHHHRAAELRTSSADSAQPTTSLHTASIDLVLPRLLRHDLAAIAQRHRVLQLECVCAAGHAHVQHAVAVDCLG